MPRKRTYIGKNVGNYRVISEYACGAYGCVYRGEHVYLKEERIVAIKFLQTHLSSQQERERFFREARLLEKLKHPHILLIYDVGVYYYVPYLVTEFASNGSLRDRINRQSPDLLKLQEVITILEQIGQALHYAHQNNIVHRDLKPENILFNADGEALLADFGIATMLDTTSDKHSEIIGIRFYSAPEELHGNVSKESDQYALGCIAYELLTGHQPFDAPDLLTLINVKKSNPPPLRDFNSSLPPYVEQAILKAMAKESAERHADVDVFITMLRATPDIPSTSQRPKEQWTDEKHKLEVDVKASTDSFDVFLCYMPTDVEAVKELAERLEDEEEIHVWFHEWEQIPGEHWQQARERGLKQARCCAIFIGEQTVNGWFEEEMGAALNRQTGDSSFRVIPVFLPNAVDLNVDAFLKLRTSVDFRNNNYAYAFYCLVRGVRGLPVGRRLPTEEEVLDADSDVANELKKLKKWEHEMNIDRSLIVEMQQEILKNWRVEDRLRKLRRWVREGIVDRSLLLEKQSDILEDH